jgi:lysophospholipase L1-like esterase
MTMGTTEKPGAPPQTPRRAGLFKLILSLIMLVLIVGGLLGAEWFVRYRERNRSRAPDYLPSIYYPHARLRYGLIPNLDYYGWFRINSLGFRGNDVAIRKPAGTIRIVCLGGSTTFDIGNLREPDSWPQVMQRDLASHLPQARIEVLNLGIPGSTALDSLIDLQIRALALQPDVVVVYQGHNDFRYTIQGPRVSEPTLYPLEQAPRSRFTRWLQVNSLLYAKSASRINDIPNRVFGALWGPAQRDVSDAERRETVRNGVGDFRSNIRAIAAIARANGIALVLPAIIFPNESGEPDQGHCSICATLVPSYRGLPADVIRTTYGEYNDVLRNEAHGSTGVTFVSTDGWVPSSDRYYTDPVHFGREGSAIMGQQMARSLQSLVKQVAGL